MKSKANKSADKPIEEMTDDELAAKLATMKRLPRGTFQVEPGVTSDSRNTKIRVTIYLDADVLKYFKERADQPNAATDETWPTYRASTNLRIVGGAVR